jgi:hypothetical protein
MENIKLLVCGGRYYDNFDEVNIVLNEIHDNYRIDTIVHGACHIDLFNYDSYMIGQPKYLKEIGADYLADCWAIKHNINQKRWPAKWHRYGRGAGPKRNYNMFWTELPDMCVAFPGGAGTNNMKKICYNIPLLDVNTWIFSNQPQKKA